MMWYYDMVLWDVHCFTKQVGSSDRACGLYLRRCLFKILSSVLALSEVFHGFPAIEWLGKYHASYLPQTFCYLVIQCCVV